MGRIKEERRAGRFEPCVALRGLRVSNTRSFSFCGKKKKKRKRQYVNRYVPISTERDELTLRCFGSEVIHDFGLPRLQTLPPCFDEDICSAGPAERLE